MMTKLLTSGSLQELHTGQINSIKEIDDRPSPVGRRNFLKFTGLGLIGLTTSYLWGSQDAFACHNIALTCEEEVFLHAMMRQRELMLSMIRALALIKYRWRVAEPTAGTITLVNPSSASAAGRVALAVVGRGRIEDLQTGSYIVPPQAYATFNVYDGPRARRPGEKALVLATNNDLRSSSMIAYV